MTQHTNCGGGVDMGKHGLVASKAVMTHLTSFMVLVKTTQ